MQGPARAAHLARCDVVVLEDGARLLGGDGTGEVAGDAARALIRAAIDTLE